MNDGVLFVFWLVFVLVICAGAFAAWHKGGENPNMAEANAKTSVGITQNVLDEHMRRTPEHVLSAEVLEELKRARAKFPAGDNPTFAALVEEVGELAKALFEEPRSAVRKEAIQVAVMAMRIVLDGDATYEPLRAGRGLGTLISTLPGLLPKGT